MPSRTPPQFDFEHHREISRRLITQLQFGPRLAEVAACLLMGYTADKEIARVLQMAVNTAHGHVQTLMTRLQCDRRAALVVRLNAAMSPQR